MGTSEPNWVDYITLVAAVLAAIGPIVKIWEIRRAGAEKFDLHINWTDFGPNHPIGEAPFLHIINKSENPILITNIRFRRGLFWRIKMPGTAIEYDYPEDVNFPYIFESKNRGQWRLQSRSVHTFRDTNRWIWWMSSIIRRSSIWLEVETAANSSQMIGAEVLIPRKDRPKWTW